MASATSCCRSCQRPLMKQASRAPCQIQRSKYSTFTGVSATKYFTYNAPLVARHSRSYASSAPPAAAIQSNSPAANPKSRATSRTSPPPQQSEQQQGDEQSATPKQPNKPTLAEAVQAQEVSTTLFKECARQADYTIPQAFEAAGSIPKNAAGEDIGQGSGFWYEAWGFNLTPTFNTWAQITFLHMWLLTVRLRCLEPEHARMWLQHLHDAFFWEAEHRMNIFHKISSTSIRQRYLKEMYNQWRGVLGAYDEGLIKGDAVLATAVWRNVFRAGQGVGGIRSGLGFSGVERGKDDIAGAGQMAKSDETGDAAVAQEIAEGDTSKMKGMQKKVAEITQAEEEAAFDWRRVACVVAFMRRGLSRLDKAPDSLLLEGKVRFGDPLKEWEVVTGVQSEGIKARFDQADEIALDNWTKGKKDI